MNKVLQKFIKWRGFFPVVFGVILAALVMRAVFLFIDYPELVYDPASYFYNAKSLAETGVPDETSWWGRDYVARFPYIYNYMGLLSVVMRVVGTNAAAAILLNTVFSAISAVLLYFIFAKGFKSRRVGLLAATLWFASPLEIAFSALPFPIIVVNTFLIAGFFAAYLLLRNRDNDNARRFWLSATALGAVLGFANMFRPMMSVLLIALALVFVYLLVRKFRARLLFRAVGGLVLAFAVMTGIQRLALIPVERATGYDNLDYYSGWSLLLGSNRESWGRWNEADDDLQRRIAEEEGYDWNAYDARLRGIAFTRYKSFAPVDFITHWGRKTFVLFGGPRDSLYFELIRFPEWIRVFYDVSARISYPVLLPALFIFGIYRFVRARKLPMFVLLVVLTLLGLAASHILLTEVMNRYFMTLVPPMFVVGFWGLCAASAITSK